MGGSSSVRVESSYIISLRELEINHVKDFIFVHGMLISPPCLNLFQNLTILLDLDKKPDSPVVSFYSNFDIPSCLIGYIEPVLVVLHEKEPTWAGRLPWKHNTCMLSALSISTTLKQHPVIWSASVSSFT